MALRKLFPKALMSRGNLSGWDFLFSVLLAGAWCLQVAPCVPQHGSGGPDSWPDSGKKKTFCRQALGALPCPGPHLSTQVRV